MVLNCSKTTWCVCPAFSFRFHFINTPKKQKFLPLTSGWLTPARILYTYPTTLSSVFLSLWGFTSSSFLVLSLHYSPWCEKSYRQLGYLFIGHEDLEKKFIDSNTLSWWLQGCTSSYFIILYHMVTVIGSVFAWHDWAQWTDCILVAINDLPKISSTVTLELHDSQQVFIIHRKNPGFGTLISLVLHANDIGSPALQTLTVRELDYALTTDFCSSWFSTQKKKAIYISGVSIPKKKKTLNYSP